MQQYQHLISLKKKCAGHVINNDRYRIGRCKVGVGGAVKFMALTLLLLLLAACEGAGEDDGSPNGGASNKVITVPADEAPQTDLVTTVEVSDIYGNKSRVLAQANGLIVRFHSGYSTSTQQSALSSANCRQQTSLPIVSGLALARLESGQTLDQAIQTLVRNPAVKYVEPNYIVSTQAIPNDPRFSSLWGLHNTGQTGGVSGADMDVPQAWDLQTGNNVVIAVIDTGVDYNHPDLVGNIWTNTDEIPNNGRDDDGNGYIDDVRGWDFSGNDNNPMDDNNHGTHVSGTIAARGNNGTGITGVNWSAQIMPLKFMNASGQGTTASAIEAIQYAVANGARISNNSWGGPGFSRALYDAIALANAAGHVFVAAAGNSSRNNDVSPDYPASFDLPNIIAVAATDENDRLAGFSNFGARSVDVAAPGVNILSSVRFSNYRSFSGTSMAAPHVAGVAGLLRASQPSLSAADVRSILISSSDSVASLAGRVVADGRVNAFQALLSLNIDPAPTPVTISISPNSSTTTVGNMIQFTATGGTAPYSWSVSNPGVASISATGQLTALAVGSTTVTAMDANANSGASGTISVTSAEPPSPAQLVISPSSAVLGVGQTVQFNVTGGVAPYSWSSSNATIASINPITGVMSGLALGAVTVSVTDNAGTTVNSGTVNIVELTITPAIGVLSVGDTLSLSVIGGTAPYSWRSSNSAVVSVNSNGVVTAIAAGNAIVSVLDNNGLTASTDAIEVRSVNVTPGNSSLLIGDTLQFSASGGVAPYLWRVSDGSVATIDSNGLLTARAAGSVSVVATDADGFSASSGNIIVRDSNVVISITPNTTRVSRNRWQLFTASGGTPPYTWRLSNPSVGTIYSETWPGWFLATGSVGATTKVIATDANGNNVESGEVTITGSRRRHR